MSPSSVQVTMQDVLYLVMLVRLHTLAAYVNSNVRIKYLYIMRDNDVIHSNFAVIQRLAITSIYSSYIHLLSDHLHHAVQRPLHVQQHKGDSGRTTSKHIAMPLVNLADAWY